MYSIIICRSENIYFIWRNNPYCTKYFRYTPFRYFWKLSQSRWKDEQKSKLGSLFNIDPKGIVFWWLAILSIAYYMIQDCLNSCSLSKLWPLLLRTSNLFRDEIYGRKMVVICFSYCLPVLYTFAAALNSFHFAVYSSARCYQDPTYHLDHQSRSEYYFLEVSPKLYSVLYRKPSLDCIESLRWCVARFYWVGLYAAPEFLCLNQFPSDEGAKTIFHVRMPGILFSFARKYKLFVIY